MPAVLASHFVLEDKYLLDLVLSWLGTKSFLFVGLVNKTFYSRYCHLLEISSSSTGQHVKQTFALESLWSVSRMRFAKLCGLNLNLRVKCNSLNSRHLPLCYWASKWAELRVISCAEKLGMKVEKHFKCWGAASSGRLPLLKSNMRVDCHTTKKSLGNFAAIAPSSNVLSWLWEREGPKSTIFTESSKSEMIRCASYAGRIECAQWLLHHGADWHEATIYEAAAHNQLEFIQWARSKGCAWGWRYGDCRNVLARSSVNIDRTFSWLHAQEDFSCNCRP
jgi:hypothetical protein